MRIAVFGLGYVGIVNLACFSRFGHVLIGCDIKKQKIDDINIGKSPIYELGVNELLYSGTKSGQIRATADAEEAIRNSEIILVCIGTPSSENGTVNIEHITKNVIEIAETLSNTSQDITIAFRSTIPPGTVEGKLRPIIDVHLTNYTGKLRLAFYPEFLREGNAVKDFFEAPRIVVGTREKEIDLLLELLNYNNDIPIIQTDTETAEFVKYVDNSFHALKIAFANEVYSIGAAFDVDVKKANDIFLSDNVLNISKAYLRPGLPFGGSCLQKDLRAMGFFAVEKKLKVPVIQSILESNLDYQERILEKVLSFSKSNILLVGLTFKDYTDDVRESPMLLLATGLIDNNIDLQIIDEDINEKTLRIDHPHIIQYLSKDFEELMKEAELVIVCKRYMEKVVQASREGQIILNFSDNDEYDTLAKMHYLFL